MQERLSQYGTLTFDPLYNFGTVEYLSWLSIACDDDVFFNFCHLCCGHVGGCGGQFLTYRSGDSEGRGKDRGHLGQLLPTPFFFCGFL